MSPSKPKKRPKGIGTSKERAAASARAAEEGREERGGE